MLRASAEQAAKEMFPDALPSDFVGNNSSQAKTQYNQLMNTCRQLEVISLLHADLPVDVSEALDKIKRQHADQAVTSLCYAKGGECGRMASLLVGSGTSSYLAAYKDPPN